MFSLELKTRPDQIPTHVDVDISELKVGSSIRIQDVVLPKGVEAEGDPTLTVVTTRAGRVAVAAKPAAGAEPVAE
jgi:large subunit ribosomal protein L25